MEVTRPFLPRQTEDGAEDPTTTEQTDDPGPTPDPSDGSGGDEGGGGGSSEGGESSPPPSSDDPPTESDPPVSDDPPVSSDPPISEPSSEPPSSEPPPSSSEPPSSSASPSSSDPPPPSSSSSVTPSITPSSSDEETTSERSRTTTTPPPTTTTTRTTTTPPPSETSDTITDSPTSSSFSSSSSDGAQLDASDSMSTIITVIDGRSTTLYSPIPTDLSSDDYKGSDRERAAIIGGATAAGVILIILLISGVFMFKRAQKRRLGFVEALRKGSREGKGAGSVGLLDDEFDDHEEPTMGQYRDTPVSSAGTPRSGHAPMMSMSGQGHARTPTTTSGQSPTPSLFRAQGGSMFHEGGVWPPPSPSSRLVDPFMKSSSEVDLGGFVDDVMRSNTAYEPPSSGHHAFASDTSSREPLLPPSTGGLPPGAAAPKKPSPLILDDTSRASSDGGHSVSSQPWIQRTPRKV